MEHSVQRFLFPYTKIRSVHYKVIRKCNYILARKGEEADKDEEEAVNEK